MIRSVMIRYFFGTITSLSLGVLFMNVMERRYPLWKILVLEMIGISAVVLPKSYTMVQTGQMPIGIFIADNRLVVALFGITIIIN